MNVDRHRPADTAVVWLQLWFFCRCTFSFFLIPAHCERRSSKYKYSWHVPGLKDDFRSSCKKWSASYWKIKSAKVQAILDVLLKIPAFVYYLCSSDGPDQAHILTLVHQLTSGSWPGSAQDSRNLETNVINGEWNKRTMTWSAVRKNCSSGSEEENLLLSFQTKWIFSVIVGGKALTAVWSTVALLDKIHITCHMKIRLLSAGSLVLPTFTFLKRKPAFCKLKSDSWVLKDVKKIQRPQ